MSYRGFALGFLIFISGAWAQQSTLGGTSLGVDKLDSSPGLYVKKKSKPIESEKQKPRRWMSTEPAQAESAETETPKVAPLPVLSESEAPPKILEQPQPEPEKKEEGSFTQQARDMFLGGDPEVVEKYRSFLDPEDIRKNFYEFTVSTGYLYNDSQSPYAYRNYLTSSPVVGFGLSLWITPFFGIDANGNLSILGRTKDSFVSDRYVETQQNWYDLGFQFRRFFGTSQRASSLTLGLRFSDHQMSVPPSSTRLIKQMYSGPRLDATMRVNKSGGYYWTFGVLVEPLMTHEENSGASNIRTGQSNETAAFGATLGGEYQLSRQTRGFFQITHKLYRSNFSGSATQTDPLTSSTPDGVPVNNTFWFLNLGLKLGH